MAKRKKIEEPIEEPLAPITKEGEFSICGKPYKVYGNNAAPINNGRCCHMCNDTVVIPARIRRMGEGLPPY